MINKKQKIIVTDNATLDDKIYTLYLHSKLQKSQDDLKNGRVMTLEESKERMKKKYANFDVN